MRGGERRPDVLIIGAQKAASTLLLHAVRDHPDVWMPDAEVPFFRDPVYAPGQVERVFAPYRQRPEPRLGLKCPDYLARPEVPARVRRHLGAPQLLCCLRDPVERAVSAYFWFMRFGLIPVEDVEVGMRRILAGETQVEHPIAEEILTWGRYHRGLRSWVDEFGPEALRVVLDTDLRDRPGDTLDAVFAFLGLPPHEPAPVTRSGRNAGIYPLPRLRFVARRAPFVTVWSDDRRYANIPKSRNPLHRGISLAIAGIDHVVLARRYGNDRPRLSADLDTELRDYYRLDVLALQELLQRDLPWSGVGGIDESIAPRGAVSEV